VFAIDYSAVQTGSYDTAAFDILPLDRPEARSNGFDSFLYDNVTFDYNEPSRAPRRLSRFYTFIVAVSDGVNEVRRVFRIYVVTEEFLQADNSILQVDTNLFQADATGDRVPLWITESNLGRFRADNYITIYLDVYDPVSLSGTITYFLLATNPDGSASVIPPGLVLDTITGELAGRVPYQAAITKTYQFTMQAVNFPSSLADINYTIVGDWTSTRIYKENEAVRYLGFVYICLQENRNVVPVDGNTWELGVATAEKTFTVDIIGEIESAIQWISPTNIGTIKPNQPSTINVLAESLLYGNKVIYELYSGSLPPGLSLLSTGIIQGKVKQFADSQGPGLTRFYDGDSSYEDSTGDVKTFNTTFDGDTTSFGKKFIFKIKARDTAQFAENIKEFFINVISSTEKTFANLYLKAFQTKDKRLDWYNFITNSNIFRSTDIYRYGDANFGIQTELKVLVFAGIESVGAAGYVQAMSQNHYRKNLKFGNVKYAVAKDLLTQEPLYEVIYVEVVDEFEKNGTSISGTVNLSNSIKSKVLVSYDAIKVDSNIPFASDSDHQRIFPNSIKNMRRRIRGVGERDREFLPLWMRSIQTDSFVETGWRKITVTSNINYLGINENFPVAGEDNDTQVFRDNFDTIKTSLNTAKTEITDLQTNAARTDVDNDFNNKLISGAVMLNNYDKKFDGGVISAPLTVDYENGNYQIFRFGATTTVEFLNFPDDTSLPTGLGKVTLELYGDGTARTLTFITSGGTVIKKNATFPATFTLTSAEAAAGSGNPVMLEVWQHKSDRIFLNYLGQFSS